MIGESEKSAALVQPFEFEALRQPGRWRRNSVRIA
jgi:hypothetical protein